MILKKRKLMVLCLFVLAAGVSFVPALPYIKSSYTHMLGQKTVPDAVKGIQAEAEPTPNAVKDIQAETEPTLESHFKKANVRFPPQQIALLGFKDEKLLELWARENDQWVYIKTYSILAASGGSGPKLKEGDRQVPEGVYRIIALNPNSNYHLAMLLDYPNKYDRKKAVEENRTNLGGDICIHGKSVSAGCLAIGDKAIEEVFYLVKKIGMKNVKVIISPYDFREEAEDIGRINRDIKWLPELYGIIREELKAFKRQ